MVYTFWSLSMIIPVLSGIAAISVSLVSTGCAGEAGTDFVESRPWRVRSRCPIAVATVLDGCLQRSSEVRRGMVDKYPLRTARRRVDCTGLPNDAFVNSTNFLSEGREITALACSSGRWIGNVQAVAARCSLSHRHGIYTNHSYERLLNNLV